MTVTLTICFNQYILLLQQTYKTLQEKIQAGLLIQSLIVLLVFQSIILQLEAVISNYQKKLDYPRKGLINIQNFDGNESFKWFIIRCLKPTDHNTGRITKDDRDFTKKLDFKDIKFLVKIRDIYKIEEKELYWHQCFWL